MEINRWTDESKLSWQKYLFQMLNNLKADFKALNNALTITICMYILGSKAESAKFVCFILRRASICKPRGGTTRAAIALLIIKQANFTLLAFEPRIYIHSVLLLAYIFEGSICVQCFGFSTLQ